MTLRDGFTYLDCHREASDADTLLAWPGVAATLCLLVFHTQLYTIRRDSQENILKKKKGMRGYRIAYNADPRACVAKLPAKNVTAIQQSGAPLGAPLAGFLARASSVLVSLTTVHNGSGMSLDLSRPEFQGLATLTTRDRYACPFLARVPCRKL